MNTLHKFKEIVETFAGVDDLASEKKSAPYFVGRALYYKLAKEHTSFSQEAIGGVVNKDHSSVFNGLKNLPQYLKDFPQYVEVLQDLEEVNFNMSPSAILSQREKMQHLKRTVVSLTRQLQDQRRVSVPDSHLPLHQLVTEVPVQHVDNVVMRLKPILRMLPKTQ